MPEIEVFLGSNLKVYNQSFYWGSNQYHDWCKKYDESAKYSILSNLINNTINLK